MHGFADQNGDVVSMWQFTGCVTVVDLSTSWCGPCQQLATEVDEMYAKYDAEGLAYVTLLSQDEDNNDTNQQDLVEWSETYGVTTTPIVADNKYTWEYSSAGLSPSLAFSSSTARCAC